MGEITEERKVVKGQKQKNVGNACVHSLNKL